MEAKDITSIMEQNGIRMTYEALSCVPPMQFHFTSLKEEGLLVGLLQHTSNSELWIAMCLVLSHHHKKMTSEFMIFIF